MNAAFGAESLAAALAAQSACEPLTRALIQPAGRAGAASASKF